MLDTSDLHGPCTHEELVGALGSGGPLGSRRGGCANPNHYHLPLIAGKAIAGMPRHRVVLATKFGHVKSDKGRWIDGTREHIRRVVAKGVDAGCSLPNGWDPPLTMQSQGTQSMQIISHLLLRRSNHACSQSHLCSPQGGVPRVAGEAAGRVHRPLLPPATRVGRAHRGEPGGLEGAGKGCAGWGCMMDTM